MITGFRTTGIYPVDRQQILKKLPNAQNQEEEANSSIEVVNDAVLAHLRENRLGSDRQKRTKRKNLNIAAGKSVSLSDLNNNAVVDDDGEDPYQADTDVEDDNDAEMQPHCSNRVRNLFTDFE